MATGYVMSRPKETNAIALADTAPSAEISMKDEHPGSPLFFVKILQS